MRALANAKDDVTLTQAELQLHKCHGARTRHAAQMAGATPRERSSAHAVAADLRSIGTYWTPRYILRSCGRSVTTTTNLRAYYAC